MSTNRPTEKSGLEAVSSHWMCKKRDGSVVPFTIDKIRRAVAGCFVDINHPIPVATALTEAAVAGVVAKLASDANATPGVEHVQRLVIQWLWTNGLFDAAESYQNYREHHRKKRELETALVFDRRVNFMPFDFPDVEQYKDAIQAIPWTVKEIPFTSDEQDFRIHLTDAERSAATNAVLAIAQIEVAVKTFWTKLGDRFRRPEFDQVGVVFGANEVVHADAYAKLLKVLGLVDRFRTVNDIPVIRARIDYLSRHLRASAGGSDRDYIKTLTLFTLFIENVSLFSQFAVMKGISRHRSLLKNVDNVVSYTFREEIVHTLFGVYMVNLVRSERPEWFDEKFYVDVHAACVDALKTESEIIAWIFESGDVDYLPRPAIVEFLKTRFNEGVTAIGGVAPFSIDRSALEPMKWFIEEIHAKIDVDKFHKRSTNYSSGGTSATKDDLF